MYNPAINLDNLHEHTEQQVFDFVVAHLRKQAKKSTDNYGSCFYRHNNASGDVLMCAAGCLISDEQYSSRMDNSNAFDCSWSGLVYENLVPNHHMSLIKQLQSAHDQHEPDFWEQEFKEIAKEFGLEF